MHLFSYLCSQRFISTYKYKGTTKLLKYDGPSSNALDNNLERWYGVFDCDGDSLILVTDSTVWYSRSGVQHH